MLKRWVMLAALLMLAGCLGGARPAPLVRQHVLDYPAPQRVAQGAPTDLLMVERFTADRVNAGPEMVYSPAPYQRAHYAGHRWRTEPADLVTDLLRRDLRASGLFRAVLQPRDLDNPRYVLLGGLEAFRETTSRGGDRTALLEATVTLLDLRRPEVSQQVLFQKGFRAEVPVTGRGAAGLAEAMSRAMPVFTQQVSAEIAAALR